MNRVETFAALLEAATADKPDWAARRALQDFLEDLPPHRRPPGEWLRLYREHVCPVCGGDLLPSDSPPDDWLVGFHQEGVCFDFALQVAMRDYRRSVQGRSRPELEYQRLVDTVWRAGLVPPQQEG